MPAVKKMTKKMMQAAVQSANGVKTSVIAAEMGVRPDTVRAWLKREDVQTYYREILHRAGMAEYAMAFRVLSDQVRGDNPWVAQNAAREIMSRLEKTVMDIDSNHITISFEGMPKIGVPESDE